jgi:hypothetical protein
MSEKEERTPKKTEVKHEEERTVDERIRDTLNRFCGTPVINAAPFCSGDGYPVP